MHLFYRFRRISIKHALSRKISNTAPVISEHTPNAHMYIVEIIYNIYAQFPTILLSNHTPIIAHHNPGYNYT